MINGERRFASSRLLGSEGYGDDTTGMSRQGGTAGLAGDGKIRGIGSGNADAFYRDWRPANVTQGDRGWSACRTQGYAAPDDASRLNTHTHDKAASQCKREKKN